MGIPNLFIWNSSTLEGSNTCRDSGHCTLWQKGECLFIQKTNSQLLSTVKIKEEQECAWRLEKQVQADEMHKQKKRLLLATVCTWEFLHNPFVLLQWHEAHLYRNVLHIWAHLNERTCIYIYHAVDDRANKDTDKPLYIQQCYIQPSLTPIMCHVYRMLIWLCWTLYFLSMAVYKINVLCQESITDSWNIPKYSTWKWCKTSIYILYTFIYLSWGNPVRTIADSVIKRNLRFNLDIDITPTK